MKTMGYMIMPLVFFRSSADSKMSYHFTIMIYICNVVFTSMLNLCIKFLYYIVRQFPRNNPCHFKKPF